MSTERQNDYSVNDLPMKDLRQAADSLVENISALQMALEKLETLNTNNKHLRTTLEKCRRIAPSGSLLVSEIEKVLMDTASA